MSGQPNPNQVYYRDPQGGLGTQKPSSQSWMNQGAMQMDPRIGMYGSAPYTGGDRLGQHAIGGGKYESGNRYTPAQPNPIYASWAKPQGGGSGGGSLPAMMNQMAQPTLGQVNVGIDAGPVWDPQQVAAATNAIRSHAPKLPSVPGATFPSPQTTGAAQELFSSNVGAEASRNASEFQRAAAYANAQQQLASEKARAGAGLGWMNLLADDYTANRALDLNQNNALLNLLASLM